MGSTKATDIRGGSRISGKDVNLYKSGLENFADFTSFFLNRPISMTIK